MNPFPKGKASDSYVLAGEVYFIIRGMLSVPSSAEIPVKAKGNVINSDKIMHIVPLIVFKPYSSFKTIIYFIL